MKKNSLIIYTLLIFLLIIGIRCSDYLSQVPSDILTLDKVFETQSSTLKFLATVYSRLPADTDDRFVESNGPWIAACDEVEFAWPEMEMHLFSNGSVQASTEVVNKMWTKLYAGIHDATIFIENASRCEELSPERLAQWTAEARAARAFYYYYLFRTFGPIPLLGENLYSLNAPASEIPVRASVDEVVEFIVSELDKAITEGLLPNIKMSGASGSYGDVGYGHIDQPIAQVIKVEALMLAASPLFNGSSSYHSLLANLDGKKLFPVYSESEAKKRWARAASEAKKFIDTYVGKGYDLNRVFTNGVLDPYLSYREAVMGYISNIGKDVESIWYYRNAYVAGYQYEVVPYHNGAPNSDYRGSGAMGATQEIVDAYFMENGLSPILGYEDDGIIPIVNPASGYQENGFSTEEYKDPSTGQLYAPKGVYNAWVNREPRFYADITFSGQKWLVTKDGDFYTELFYSGNSGKGINKQDYSRTGYVVRKGAPMGSWTTANRVRILLRVAQIYLDYAEALNEADPGNPDILKYLNLIRERAGIPSYGGAKSQIPVQDDSQAGIRELIRKERRVELSFENCRYFDVRRWLVLEETQNKPIHGLNVDANPPKFYERTMVKERLFEPKHYFFPIPEKELNKLEQLVQNPGY